MKLTKLLSLTILASFIMFSCSKSEESDEQNCEFDAELCEIKTFCVWPPAINTPIPLPVAFYYNGAPANHEYYTFEWSSNLSFGGSAISLSYEDLPVTVNVTEKETGCEVALTLTAN